MVVIKRLIHDNMYEPDLIDSQGNSAFLWALCYKNETVALKLLESGKIDPNYIDPFGNHALSIACRHKMENVADILVHLSDPTIHYIDDGAHGRKSTTLIQACKTGLSDVAKILIEKGVNPSITNKDNDTALLWAIDQNMNDVAIQLINTGLAIPGHVDCDGKTSLLYCCHTQGGDMTDVALALIRSGQSAHNYYDYDGNNALIKSLINSLTEIAKTLLDQPDIDIHQVNKWGNDALIYACYHNFPDIAIRLMEMGANTTQINGANNTAFLYACYHGMEEVALKIVEKGNYWLGLKGDTGKCAKDYIVEKGLTKLIERLGLRSNFVPAATLCNEIM